MKELLSLSSKTKKVLLGIFIIIIISFLVAFLYYNSKNRSEDPRIVQTKYMFREYDNLMKANQFTSGLKILDRIDSILLIVPGYKDSYERAIVSNNRGSAYLGMALYNSTDSTEKNRLLTIAKINIDSSISVYNNWLNKHTGLPKEELYKSIYPFFQENDPAFKGKNLKKILKKRVEDLETAQKETPRRLSVCYTNMGAILRHQYKQDEAVKNYLKAIELWKDNYTARNNFNVLMGKPPKDRSIINQLFPPDKKNYN
jgi:tetratricopeptide (TPR) repeat protein